MRNLLIATLFVVACGGDDGSSTKMDAAMQNTDSSMQTIDAPAAAPDCPTYCTAIMTACTAARAQYDSMQNCLDSCGTLPVGTAGASSGNSLGCRATHAEMAKTDPATHCEHAGPAGAGACGTLCEGFCAIGVAKCATQWPTAGACATACGNFTNTPPYAVPESGNTAQCRLYHMTMAATLPGGHCSHTMTTSATCN